MNSKDNPETFPECLLEDVGRVAAVHDLVEIGECLLIAQTFGFSNDLDNRLFHSSGDLARATDEYLANRWISTLSTMGDMTYASTTHFGIGVERVDEVALIMP